MKSRKEDIKANMGRKPTPITHTFTQTENPNRRLIVQLPEETHRALKTKAAEQGQTISHIIRTLIDKELNN